MYMTEKWLVPEYVNKSSKTEKKTAHNSIEKWMKVRAMIGRGDPNGQ